MQEIAITRTGPSEYDVTVAAQGTTTTHHVSVPRELRDELGVGEDGEERLVRESFVFLLEREPNTSILREFALDVISRYFPDYRTEIGARLG